MCVTFAKGCAESGSANAVAATVAADEPYVHRDTRVCACDSSGPERRQSVREH